MLKAVSSVEEKGTKVVVFLTPNNATEDDFHALDAHQLPCSY